MSPSKDYLSNGALAERSPNTLSPSKTMSSDKLSLMDEKTAIPKFEPTLQHPPSQNGSSQAYISPSDAIRSPTTKKLSEIKGKRFANAKPKTLFAQTLFRENLKFQGHQLDQDGDQRTN